MARTLREQLLQQHLLELKACRACPQMIGPVVTGRSVLSKVMLVGQAPGQREPIAQKPFAWTAGKTLFGWFDQIAGVTEDQVRNALYFAAVCRCFPGKTAAGGDRVPAPREIANCEPWLQKEIQILKPELIIPVGKLAIRQFLSFEKLEEVIGRAFVVSSAGHSFDLIPLPHPSGASTWHRVEPGKTLLRRGLKKIGAHPAFRFAFKIQACK